MRSPNRWQMAETVKRSKKSPVGRFETLLKNLAISVTARRGPTAAETARRVGSAIIAAPSAAEQPNYCERWTWYRQIARCWNVPAGA